MKTEIDLSKATPRPWSFRPDYESSKLYIHCGRTISEINYHNDVEAHSNAALIVKAVNEHAALVAVAEAANELQHSENSTTSVMGVSVVKQPLMTVLREKLAALAAARQQSPTPS